MKYERKYNQPKTSSISNALYYWTRIQKEKRNFENPNDNQVDLESEPISDNIDVESELFELNEVDQATEKNIKQPNLKWLTIFDDEPTPLLVKGYNFQSYSAQYYYLRVLRRLSAYFWHS